MRTLSPLASAALTVAVVAGLTACGGGSGGSSSTETTVTGSAVKGPVNGAKVAVTKASDGSACGETTTNSAGAYSLATSCTGDLVVTVSGGSYLDEATNTTKSLDAPLKVVVSANGGTVTGMATPLTTLAYTYAFPSGTAVSASRFSTAAANVASQFNLSGVNLATTLPSVGSGANDYGRVLAAVSEYLRASGVTLQSLVGSVMAESQWASFSTAFSGAYEEINDRGFSFSFNGSNLTVNLGGGGTGGTGGTGGGTGSLSITVSISGVPSPTAITVNGVPKPANQTEFCADLQNDSSFQSIGASGGGTLTINSCSFSGNKGTVNATLSITSPMPMTLPYTVTYTYN